MAPKSDPAFLVSPRLDELSILLFEDEAYTHRKFSCRYRVPIALTERRLERP
jgi:hypothetical protein